MYAIIKTGGKQYRVAKGDIVKVELLGTEQGKEIEFDDILFVSDESKSAVGAPSLSDFVVKGEVIGTTKGPKIVSVKYKRSHNQRRKFGHRQHYSQVKITEIGARHQKKKEAKHGA